MCSVGTGLRAPWPGGRIGAVPAAARPLILAYHAVSSTWDSPLAVTEETWDFHADPTAPDAMWNGWLDAPPPVFARHPEEGEELGEEDIDDEEDLVAPADNSPDRHLGVAVLRRRRCRGHGA